MSSRLGTGLITAASLPGPNTAFHAGSLAAIATGSAVLVTAGDLGPYAPMLLALGFYVVFFGLFAEAAFIARHLAAAGARRLLRDRAAEPRPSA